jgi:hypothetical protein
MLNFLKKLTIASTWRNLCLFVENAAGPVNGKSKRKSKLAAPIATAPSACAMAQNANAAIDGAKLGPENLK